jgi:hypothetical protein
MEKTMVKRWRAPRIKPIIRGEALRWIAQSGRITVTTLLTVLPKVPVA